MHQISSVQIIWKIMQNRDDHKLLVTCKTITFDQPFLSKITLTSKIRINWPNRLKIKDFFFIKSLFWGKKKWTKCLLLKGLTLEHIIYNTTWKSIYVNVTLRKDKFSYWLGLSKYQGNRNCYKNHPKCGCGGRDLKTSSLQQKNKYSIMLLCHAK